jgi:predicted transposase/invertase (TIGR01784 family)
MTTYLDPKIDTLFKKIFGENKDLLISFLNSLLPLQDGQEIVSIEYLSSEQVPATALGKNSIVDVNCVDNSGRAFIVEMQSEWSNIFKKRLLVNGSKAVIKQMDKQFIEDKAKKYNELKPVYVLAVVNGSFSKGKDWYHHLKIIDSKNPDVVIDGLDYVLLELPNFTPETWNLAHKKLAVLWLRFLKEIDGYYEKLPEEFVSNKLIYSAIKICERSSFSSKELFSYDHAQTQARWDDSIKGLEDEVMESRKNLAQKDKTLAEKDKTLAEKDKVLAEKVKEIEELKKQLGR